MQVATIVPQQFLPLTDNETFFMALAHLIEEGNSYTEFFRNRAKQGAYVLMDNGAAEHSQLKSFEQVLAKADLIGATEVVLMDSLMHKEETLKRTQGCLNYLRESGRMDDFKWMAVPQGKDLSWWKYCLINMLDMDKDRNINSIGISKFLTLNLTSDARVVALNIALKLLEEYDRTDIDIHLLGCAYDPSEVSYIEQLWPGRVRSVDSAIAYVYAQKGLELSTGIARPEFEIEFLADHEIDIQLLVENIKRWKGLEDIGKL